MNLLEAYKNTHYTTELGMTLFIGRSNAELEVFMESKGYREAIYITAWNPFSQVLTATENASRNQELLKDVEQETLSFHIEKGIGKDPSGNWPGEESFLLVGLCKEIGHRLALKYEQNAFVYYPRNGVAELVTTPLFEGSKEHAE